MLEARKNWTLELFPFIHSAYEKPSSLYFGDRVSPWKLKSKFRVFYLDSGTLAGNLSDVLQDGNGRRLADQGLQMTSSNLYVRTQPQEKLSFLKSQTSVW